MPDDLFSILSDKQVYSDWLNDGDDNAIMLQHVRKAMSIAIQRELTEKQREYLILRVVDRMSVVEIAELKGVNKSTVSRTIRLAESKLRRCLRYAAPWLLNLDA